MGAGINNSLLEVPYDVVIVRGMIVRGVSTLDESLITAESMAVDKAVRDESNTIYVRVDKVGNKTVLYKVIISLPVFVVFRTEQLFGIKQASAVFRFIEGDGAGVGEGAKRRSRRRRRRCDTMRFSFCTRGPRFPRPRRQ